MRFRKVYIEISNLCNLKCSFCPGTKRAPKRMSADEFSLALSKIKPYTKFIYFHIMGEPLSHPLLEEFLSLADEGGFRVIITTNGTLLKSTQNILLFAKALHRINISLHAFEANDFKTPFDDYLKDCFEFGKAVNGEKIVVYRLWNNGGAEKLNNRITEKMKEFFPNEWSVGKQATTVAPKTFLEYGDKFDWPDLNLEADSSPVFCYGLRDQLGILCDGTVVPCCLDHEGDISLGNIFTESLEDILASKKAISIYEGFSKREAVEPLCQRCDYARKFSS